MTFFHWMIEDQLFSYYAANLRGSLFTSFLTLSGFLLSAKTFVIIQLYKEVYSTTAYRKHTAKKLRTNNSSYELRLEDVFRPLRHFTLALQSSIVLCLITSFSQFSIGLIAMNWSAVICIFLAIAAFASVCTSVFLMIVNIRTWFDLLPVLSEEKDHVDQVKGREAFESSS